MLIISNLLFHLVGVKALLINESLTELLYNLSSKKESTKPFVLYYSYIMSPSQHHVIWCIDLGC